MLKLQFVKALWGMQGSLEEQFARIAEAGYSGVESPMPSAEDEERFRYLLKEHGLDYIAMVFTTGSSVEEHIRSFERQVERAAGFSPVLINAHSARDVMGYGDQLVFYRRAVGVERGIGLPIGHETHRGRAMFAPWTTGRLLEDVPELRLVADFSHWVCVCESLLPDMGAYLDQAISRTIHIHGRVGYAQGPQVPDPSAPEYSRELAVHMGWWERIVAERAKQGAEAVTFTPEFGPPPYLHTLPHTGAPVADLWKVCLWMRDYAAARLQV